MALSKVNPNLITQGASGRKNLISNGSFQISQRGGYTSTTAAANNTYYVDRFRITAASVNVSNQHTTVSIGGVSKRAYRVTATSAATGYFGSRHGIELLDLEVGATYTISCWMRSNKSNARIRQDTIGAISADSTMSHTGGGDWEKITFTVDSTNTVANCALQFICYPAAAVSVGDYIEIADVQMEVGSVATDFEHRSYGEELQLCKRYFQTIGGELTGEALCAISAWNGGDNYGVLKFPVEMRVAPSSTTTGDTSWTLLSGAVTAPSTSVVVQLHTKKGFEINISRSGYFTTGRAGWVRGTTATKILADAEL